MRLLASLVGGLVAYNGVLAAALPTVVEERHVEERLVGPAVTISKPTATVVGRTVPYADVNPIAAGSLESFKQIPFAQPPVGSLRLKPPVALDATKNLGTIDATALAAKACPQQIMSEQKIPWVPNSLLCLLRSVFPLADDKYLARYQS